MICVIADDLTGAAEIGGVALRYGLTAEVQSEFQHNIDMDLICVDTNSRSCTEEEAIRRVAQVAEACRSARVEHVFKKVDSVLRGRVVAELTALIDILEKRRGLLVPANPTLGRVILNGRYFINGTPLHETDFATDPEYPAHTSDVLGVLGVQEPKSVCILKPCEEMLDTRIVVGEANSYPDLHTWARKVDEVTVPAGAAEFFAAFLEAGGFLPAKEAKIDLYCAEQASRLFVCGSISLYSRSFCRDSEARGIPVLRMPVNLFDSTSPSFELIQEWAEAAIRALDEHPSVIIAIDRPISRESDMPQKLSDYLGLVVEHVLERRPVHNVLVEGGATATAVFRHLGWKRLLVQQELAPGVVCMRVEGGLWPLTTLKPGSYPWPDEVWK